MTASIARASYVARAVGDPVEDLRYLPVLACVPVAAIDGVHAALVAVVLAAAVTAFGLPVRRSRMRG